MLAGGGQHRGFLEWRAVLFIVGKNYSLTARLIARRRPCSPAPRPSSEGVVPNRSTKRPPVDSERLSISLRVKSCHRQLRFLPKSVRIDFRSSWSAAEYVTSPSAARMPIWKRILPTRSEPRECRSRIPACPAIPSSPFSLTPLLGPGIFRPRQSCCLVDVPSLARKKCAQVCVFGGPHNRGGSSWQPLGVGAFIGATSPCLPFMSTLTLVSD